MADDTFRTPERELKHPPIPFQKWAMFADESSITNDLYTVVGGTIIESRWLSLVYQMIFNVRERYDLWGELKWSKVSDLKADGYRALIDGFFQYIDAGRIQFRCMTFENSRWDHQRFNDGDPDKGLSKLYFQLLLHQYVRDHGDLGLLFVCLDRRRSTTSLEDLKRMLNRKAATQYGLEFEPVRVLTSRDSKRDDMLQLNDVILGAITAYKNQRHTMNETRAAKRDLARLVFNRSGLRTVDSSSPRTATKFKIWNHKSRK